MTTAILQLALVCSFWTTPALSRSQPQHPVAKFVGYYDAAAQLELSPADVLRDSTEAPFLTHLVLVNALKVDMAGELHLREASQPGEVAAEELVAQLGKLPVKLILSIRGQPDDVAFDELAESEEVRARFTASLTEKLTEWRADGVEVEWHADDPVGGKAKTEAFDGEERKHFELLCRDLSTALRARQRSLSIAVRPGRLEFDNSSFVRENIDWLSVRAYSMRSVGDPHHASLKDMQVALDEWESRGVPRSLLVLGTPLFGRPGASLRLSGRERAEGSRKPWRELANASQHSPFDGDEAGDVFVELGNGKAWWASGPSTTKAKVEHVLRSGYGGLAFRDLHHDSTLPGQSIVRAAAEASRKGPRGRRRPKLKVASQAPALFQMKVMQSKAAAEDAGAEAAALDGEVELEL